MKGFFGLLGALLLVLLSGCATPPTPTAAIPDGALMVVPGRVLTACNAPTVPESGDGRAVTDALILNYASQGQCSFLGDLKSDYLRAASDLGTRVKVYEPVKH